MGATVQPYNVNTSLLGQSIDTSELDSTSFLTWDQNLWDDLTADNFATFAATLGYITDGNTNWDNSYGFITASSTETLTNKSGNISMWTNDSGYLTAADTYWQLNNQQLSPKNTTFDLMTGGTGTASAKFYAQGTTGNGYFAGNLGIGTTNPSGNLEVKTPAQASTAEEIAHFSVADDSTAYVSIRNNSSTDNLLIPQLRFKGSGSNIAGNIQAMITTDTGSQPAWAFSGQLASSALTVRPIMAIRNYTTDLFTIMANGSVGIGTTNPSSLLEVAGDINTTTGTFRMAGTDYGQYFIDAAGVSNQVWTSDGSGRGGWQDLPGGSVSYLQLNGQQLSPINTTFDLMTGGTGTASAKFYATGTTGDGYFAGNLGIGTTNPLHSLQIQSGDLYLAETNDGTRIMLNNDGPTYYMGIGSRGTTSHSYLEFGRATNHTEAITPLMSLDDAGNVGIGTTDPTSALHVNGVLTLQEAGQTQTSFIETVSYGLEDGWTRFTAGGTNNVAFEFRDNTNALFALGTTGNYSELVTPLQIDNNLNVANDLFVNTSTHNVGIGTTNPGYKFEVVETSDADKTTIHAYSSQSSTSTDYINIAITGEAQGSMTGWGRGIGVLGAGDHSNSWQNIGVYGLLGINPSTNFDFSSAIWGDGNSTGFAGIFTGGYVGIGTTDPGYALQVAGDIDVTTGNTYRLAGADIGQYFITAAGNNGEVWTSDGAGAGHWASAGSSSSFFQLSGQQLSPVNALVHDILVGGTSTASATIALQANTGKITAKALDINNGSSLFSVSDTGITSSLPTAFTSAGDVSMAYDLILSNQTASSIKSDGPLTIASGETFESNNLTLQTYNFGSIILQTAITSAQLTDAGHFIPENNNIQDLGSPSNRWRDIFLGSNSLHIGSSTGESTISYDSANNRMRFNSNGTGDPEMTIDSTGKVGIGTTNPGYKFQVVIDGSNEGHVAADGSWARTSDLNYKQNITSLTDSLSKVMDLRAIRYDSTTASNINPGQGQHIGFIAQELEQIYPEFVSTDNTGRKGVSYESLTPVLVQAVQQLNSQVTLQLTSTGDVVTSQSAAITTLQTQTYDLNVTQATHTNLLSNLVASIQSLFTRQTAVETQVADLQTQVASIAAVPTPAPTPIPTASPEAATLVNDVATLSARVSYLEQRVTGTVAPAPEPIATIAGTIDIAPVETRLTDLESTIASLSGQVDLSLELTASQSALINALSAAPTATTSSVANDLNLDVQSIFVSDFLSVLGDTILTNLTVTNNLTASSITPLDGQLSLVAGLVTLDGSGSIVTINGDLTVTGKLTAAALDAPEITQLASTSATISSDLLSLQQMVASLSAQVASLSAQVASPSATIATDSAQLATPSAIVAAPTPAPLTSTRISTLSQLP